MFYFESLKVFFKFKIDQFFVQFKNHFQINSLYNSLACL